MTQSLLLVAPVHTYLIEQGIHLLAPISPILLLRRLLPMFILLAFIFQSTYSSLFDFTQFFECLLVSITHTSIALKHPFFHLTVLLQPLSLSLFVPLLLPFSNAMQTFLPFSSPGPPCFPSEYSACLGIRSVSSHVETKGPQTVAALSNACRNRLSQGNRRRTGGSSFIHAGAPTAGCPI